MLTRDFLEGYTRLYPLQLEHGLKAIAAAGQARLEAKLAQVDDDGRRRRPLVGRWCPHKNGHRYRSVQAS